MYKGLIWLNLLLNVVETVRYIILTLALKVNSFKPRSESQLKWLWLFKDLVNTSAGTCLMTNIEISLGMVSFETWRTNWCRISMCLLQLQTIWSLHIFLTRLTIIIQSYRKKYPKHSLKKLVINFDYFAPSHKVLERATVACLR